MKKYCFVTNLSLADEPTVANRLFPYIAESIKNKNKVVLVSSDEKPIESFDSSLFKHVTTPKNSSKPSSFLKRAIFEWNESRYILKEVIKLDVDLVVLTIPSMFLLFNASIIKEKELCLDVRDLTWEYLSNNGVQLLGKLLFRFMFNISYKLFNSIVVSNDTELVFFQQKKVRALLYSNGVDYDQFRDLSTLPKKNSNNFVISYIGKIGVAQNLKVLVLAAESLKDMQFNIVGYGSEYDKIQKLILNKNLKNIALYRKVDWDKVLHFYQESDVLYAQLTENFSGAMPSKLYQYLNTGRFVIYGGRGQACKTLSSFSNNITIPPDDFKKLISAIKTAKDISKKGFSSNENIVIIKNKYIREKNVQKILQKLESS